MMGVAISKNGCKIRLTRERWNHIARNHIEMENYFNTTLKTVADPDLIVKGRKDELLALRKINQKYLAIIYKELKPTGFIITAFITSKIEQIKKRGVIWEKKRSEIL